MPPEMISSSFLLRRSRGCRSEVVMCLNQIPQFQVVFTVNSTARQGAGRAIRIQYFTRGILTCYFYPGKMRNFWTPEIAMPALDIQTETTYIAFCDRRHLAARSPAEVVLAVK